MNIAKIQKSLASENLDALLLVSSQNRQYATGFKSSAGAVVIMQSAAYFFTDSRYIESAKLNAKGVEVAQVTIEKSTEKLICEALLSHSCKRVGAEDKFLTSYDWNFFEKSFNINLIPAQNVMEKLRSVKEPYEVQSISAAQRIAEKALQETMPLIKPGIMEREIAAELTYRMLLLGAEGNSFDPICIAGAKTSMPHGVPGDEKVKNGDFVTMDFGCIKNGYCSDMTRTVAVGFATSEMKKVYNTVLSAQLAGIEIAKAGVTGADVHLAGARVIEDAGYGEYFGHGFGHSVGLDIHEAPNASPGNKKPLEAGNVITAEPGIYLPERFGVRIEDMILITDCGNENLTNAPKELVIL